MSFNDEPLKNALEACRQHLSDASIAAGLRALSRGARLASDAYDDSLLRLGWLAFRFAFERWQVNGVAVPLALQAALEGKRSFSELIVDLQTVGGDPKEVRLLLQAPPDVLRAEIAE